MTRTTVINGSIGKDAFDAQRALNGFHISQLVNSDPGLDGAPLREDGSFGLKSITALNSFKDRVSMLQDGILDDPAWAELEPYVPDDPLLPDAILTYGVPTSNLIQGFHPGGHGGVDVSPKGVGNGDVEDARRGVPVYLTIKSRISRDELNGVQLYDGQAGLGFAEGADAELSEIVIIPQPYPALDDASYGGVLGVAARYQYDDGGASQVFTFYVEYEHLITPEYPPKNSAGDIASLADYGATNKGIGFGSKMVATDNLFAGDLDGMVLIGFLGATQTPHVHVQTRFKQGAWGYLGKLEILLDPGVVVMPLLDLHVVTP